MTGGREDLSDATPEDNWMPDLPDLPDLTCSTCEGTGRHPPGEPDGFGCWDCTRCPPATTDP